MMLFIGGIWLAKRLCYYSRAWLVCMMIDAAHFQYCAHVTAMAPMGHCCFRRPVWNILTSSMTWCIQSKQQLELVQREFGVCSNFSLASFKDVASQLQLTLLQLLDAFLDCVLKHLESKSCPLYSTHDLFLISKYDVFLWKKTGESQPCKRTREWNLVHSTT